MNRFSINPWLAGCVWGLLCALLAACANPKAGPPAVRCLLWRPGSTTSTYVLVRDEPLVAGSRRLEVVWQGRSLEEASQYLQSQGIRHLVRRDLRHEGYELPEYDQIEKAREFFARKGQTMMCLPTLCCSVARD